MDEFVGVIVGVAAGLGVLLYLAVFVAALFETVLGVGLIVPGSALLLVGGVAVSDYHEKVLFVIGAAFLGALLGDNVNYYLGRTYGYRWVKEEKKILAIRHFEEGERFFERHGGKSVLLGRFVPVIKEIVPFIAGMVQMDRKRFMIYNALGALGWATKWVGLGYLFGHYMADVKRLVLTVDLGLLLLLLAMFGYYIFTRRAVSHKK